MLTKRNTDASVRQLLSEFEWVILPVFNVDGYEFTHTEVCFSPPAVKRVLIFKKKTCFISLIAVLESTLAEDSTTKSRQSQLYWSRPKQKLQRHRMGK